MDGVGCTVMIVMYLMGSCSRCRGVGWQRPGWKDTTCVCVLIGWWQMCWEGQVVEEAQAQIHDQIASLQYALAWSVKTFGNLRVFHFLGQLSTTKLYTYSIYAYTDTLLIGLLIYPRFPTTCPEELPASSAWATSREAAGASSPREMLRGPGSERDPREPPVGGHHDLQFRALHHVALVCDSHTVGSRRVWILRVLQVMPCR